MLGNKTLTPNGPRVISATKDIMQAHSKGNLQLDNLPIKLRVAHKMPVSQNLVSLGVLADDNMTSILDKNKIMVCRDKSVLITLSEAPVLTGRRAPNAVL